MDRRAFLKGAAAAVVAGSVRLRHAAAAPGESLVAVAEGTDYAAITRRAVNVLGGMKAVVKRGDVVVVKPNTGWDRAPEFAANTHPLVVRVLNTVIASRDIVAADAYATTLFALRPADIPITVAAARRGLGQMDLRKIRVITAWYETDAA